VNERVFLEGKNGRKWGVFVEKNGNRHSPGKIAEIQRAFPSLVRNISRRCWLHVVFRPETNRSISFLPCIAEISGCPIRSPSHHAEQGKVIRTAFDGACDAWKLFIRF
jgi:hypothetical protein